MPSTCLENDFDGFSSVESTASSGSLNGSPRWGRRKISALLHVVWGKDIELYLAGPRVGFGHVSVSYAFRAYFLLFEIMRFQPVAQAHDRLLIGTEINYNIDVLGQSHRLDLMLKSKQPHHLATNQAPAGLEVLVKIQQDPPALCLRGCH